ncbi:hypothetical protein TESG_06417 [Trichophyton tonsurans CBS 112818]|uniref:Uncharacterized protein n=1 Tax=Trichophyton tonsurans (strain CBS 112818) TaxID=647933 RepID=F2S660_TRIT1|nr:hypothetical protein TESG_06417 [Trichophyton tonsurans CBS 112818]
MVESWSLEVSRATAFEVMKEELRAVFAWPLITEGRASRNMTARRSSPAAGSTTCRAMTAIGAWQQGELHRDGRKRPSRQAESGAKGPDAASSMQIRNSIVVK